MTKNIISRLKFIRKRLNFSQKNFAKTLGINIRTYQDYEQGRRCMGLETLNHISEKLGVTIDFLLGKSNCITIEGDDLFEKIKENIN